VTSRTPLRRFAIAAAVVVFGLAACSRGEDDRAGPEEVVRAWSRALNAGDNRAAAALFAVGARIEQFDFVLTVRTLDDALIWNRTLPCSGKIVELTTQGEEQATATFLLGDRKTSPCDAPGGEAVALFRVREGKIVLFRQLPAEAPPEDAI
jgi:hypothetical protein